MSSWVAASTLVAGDVLVQRYGNRAKHEHDDLAVVVSKRTLRVAHEFAVVELRTLRGWKRIEAQYRADVLVEKVQRTTIERVQQRLDALEDGDGFSVHCVASELYA